MDIFISVAAVIIFVLLAAAVSRRIQTTIITLPILYTLFGLVLSDLGLGLVTLSLDNEMVQLIAELTIVLVLATDASRINLRVLARDHDLPIRLLGLGLPLTMIAGTAAAAAIFTDLSFWEAAILGIILSPTDASLGMAVVTNPKVPVRVRQSLNIESGLNDGIAVPFLLMAISFAAAEETNQVTYWLTFGAQQIIFGILVGLVVGFAGNKFVQWGRRSRWMSLEFQKITSILIPILVYLAANMMGGNGLFAAFFAGVVAGNIEKDESAEELHRYAEVEVQFMMMLTFMIVFGAVMLPIALQNITGPVLLYAVLSLTVVRLLPVAISMIGEKIKPVTIGFLGWFGPRGIASILYLFTVLDEEGLANTNLIYTTVLITVLLSVFAHGMTAVPGTNLYCRLIPSRMQPDDPEMATVSEMPIRTPFR